MGIRTDLISEQRELHPGELPGTECSETESDGVRVSRVRITGEEAAQTLGKPCGCYITAEFGNLLSMSDFDSLASAVEKALGELLPEADRESVLVAGLGNTDITPDALGPLTVDKLLCTRHISRELAGRIGLKGLKSVSAVAPGVLGKTGIEAAEILRGITARTRPTAMIVIDALAARRPARLCRTVQFSDTGICPGSGVGNARKAIDRSSFGFPVIALGIPTVTEAGSLIFDRAGSEPPEEERSMLVTPKDIDLLVGRAAEMLSFSLNRFLQPEIDRQTLLAIL